MGIQQLDVYDVTCDKCHTWSKPAERVFLPRGGSLEQILKSRGWKHGSLGERLLCPNCEDE